MGKVILGTTVMSRKPKRENSFKIQGLDFEHSSMTLLYLLFNNNDKIENDTSALTHNFIVFIIPTIKIIATFSVPYFVDIYNMKFD